MRVPKMFIKVWGCKGQSMSELLIALPVFAVMLTGSIDLAKLTYTHFRISTAAYEATKLVPQVSGDYDIQCNCNCTKTDPNDSSICVSQVCEATSAKPNLCMEMQKRAKQVLKDSGLDPDAFIMNLEPQLENFSGDKKRSYLGLTLTFQYNYSVTLGKLSQKIVTTPKIFYGIVRPGAAANTWCLDYSGSYATFGKTEPCFLMKDIHQAPDKEKEKAKAEKKSLSYPTPKGDAQNG